MPFKSRAQWAKFYADPRLRKHAKKWAAHTKTAYGKLPKRKGKAKGKRTGS